MSGEDDLVKAQSREEGLAETPSEIQGKADDASAGIQATEVDEAQQTSGHVIGEAAESVSHGKQEDEVRKDAKVMEGSTGSTTLSGDADEPPLIGESSLAKDQRPAQDTQSPSPPPPPEKEEKGGVDSTDASTPTTSAAPAMRPESVQHRHDSNGDNPAAYAPPKVTTYLHMKALALQMPNNTTFAQQSNSHHVDPPVLILEARTNLSSARRSFYPRITRSLPELQLWILALTLSFPAGIFSPFTYPSATLAASGSMEDAAIRSYLGTITKQFARILSKPYVLSHPATVALVDCDFNYNPGMPHVGPGSSLTVKRKLDEGMALARGGHDPLRGKSGKGGAGHTPTASWDADGVAAALGLPSLPSQSSGDTFGAPAPSSSKGPLSIFSRANASPQRIQPQPSVPIPPGEEDFDEEELTAARNEITRLEMQFEKASRAAQTLVERNGAMTATLHQLTNALTDLAKLDEGRTVARKKREGDDMTALTKGIEGWTSAQAGANAAMMSTIVPSMSYQSMNARSAIDALLRRAAAATHRHSALVVLVQKRREAERMKRARGEIRQEDVDWILQELRDAQRTTHVLTHHLSTFTATLKEELKDHSRNTHTDIQDSLLQHARNSIRAQKFVLTNIVRARDALVALRENKTTAEEVNVAQDELRDAEQKREVVLSEGGAAKAATVVVPDSTVEGVEPENGTSIGQPEIVGSQTDASPEVAPSEPSRPAQQGEKEVSSIAEQDPIGAREEEGSSVTSTIPPLVPPPPSSEPLLTPEPSPWAISGPAAATPWGQAESPGPASASAWSVSVPSAPQTLPEPSPWGDQVEDAGRSGLGDTAQSAFLPPREANPFGDAATLHSNPSAPPMSANLAQSAFLPGRDMSRYANPFARMDGGASSALPPMSSTSGRPSAGQEAPTGPFSAGSNAVPPSGSNSQPAKPSNDPWANRKRISASDAARGLAGRF